MTKDESLIVLGHDELELRRQHRAEPLDPSMKRGDAAEIATRRSAAKWGLPDFVFDPVQVPSGSGVREVSDGIVLIGNRALMLQSKARDGAFTSPEGEGEWLDKAITRAAKQATGSLKSLSRRTVAMTNRRGRTFDIDGSAYEWTTVILIDHDHIPDGYRYGALPQETVVLLRDDWDFLFEQLRSTRWVADYLDRVAGEPIDLGTESVRYYELANADARAEPDSRTVFGPDDRIASWPGLPLRPAVERETRAHLELRRIMEALAESVEETKRLAALGAIDTIPIEARTELGTVLAERKRSLSYYTGSGFKTQLRGYAPTDPDDPHGAPLLFMISTVRNAQSVDSFKARLAVLHHDFYTDRRIPPRLSVGVLITPRANGRGWRHTLKIVEGTPVYARGQLEHYRRQLDTALIPT